MKRGLRDAVPVFCILRTELENTIHTIHKKTMLALGVTEAEYEEVEKKFFTTI